MSYVVAALVIGYFLAVAFSAMVLLLLFIHLAVMKQRFIPLLWPLVAGTIAYFGLSQIGYPRWAGFQFFTSLIVAALVFPLSLSRQDWDLVGSSLENPQTDRWRNVFMVVGGVITAILGAISGIGRPLLLSLRYDVHGYSPEEFRDIRIAGGIVGFLVGAFFSLLIWSAVVRRFRRS